MPCNKQKILGSRYRVHLYRCTGRVKFTLDMSQGHVLATSPCQSGSSRSGSCQKAVSRKQGSGGGCPYSMSRAQFQWLLHYVRLCRNVQRSPRRFGVAKCCSPGLRLVRFFWHFFWEALCRQYISLRGTSRAYLRALTLASIAPELGLCLRHQRCKFFSTQPCSQSHSLFYCKASFMLFRHRGPYRRTAQITTLEDTVQRPRMVNSQPLPIPLMMGAPTIAPIQLRIFRTKLFTATPDEDLFGMNSVSIVVAMAKMSMLPMP